MSQRRRGTSLRLHLLVEQARRSTLGFLRGLCCTAFSEQSEKPGRDGGCRDPGGLRTEKGSSGGVCLTDFEARWGEAVPEPKTRGRRRRGAGAGGTWRHSGGSLVAMPDCLPKPRRRRRSLSSAPSRPVPPAGPLTVRIDQGDRKHALCVLDAARKFARVKLGPEAVECG